MINAQWTNRKSLSGKKSKIKWLKKEKELYLRYFEREPLILVIEGSIINYDDFSDEDLNKINEEKKTSKKRRVLENPWLQREISEYIDYIPPKIDISVLKRCF